MITARLDFELPDGVPVHEVMERARQAVKGAVRDEVWRSERLALCNQALATDQGLERWAEWIVRNTVSTFNPLAVRASTYDSVKWDQEFKNYIDHFLFGEVFDNDPRRPVIMKGCLFRMIRLYSWHTEHSANGYCYKVAKRYLRKNKFTTFDRGEAHEMKNALSSVLRKKFYLSYHFDKALCGLLNINSSYRDTDRPVWLNGKKRYLTEHQFNYLIKLHQIIQKTRHLDKRIEMLRSYRRQEAA